MQPDPAQQIGDSPLSQALCHEHAVLEKLFASARRARDSFKPGSEAIPRFVANSAKSMARHLALSDCQVQGMLPAMAMWQAFLPAALGKDTAYFRQTPDLFPYSYEILRAELAKMESYPQLVIVAFHMAGFPLVAAMLAAAWAQVHGHPLHLLIATRNMGWLHLQSGRWAFEAGEIIGTDRGGLRRLLSGLKQGTIKRLLFLADGPHAPDAAGTRTLMNISPGLGFKTGLITSILSMDIPIRPLVHYWEREFMTLDWRPMINRAGVRSNADAKERAVSEVAAHIEGLLQAYPEQWLNWAGASLKT